MGETNATPALEQREAWGSRAAFVLAATGSAVGLGNIWRFPHEVYSQGGGAFLIPYVIALAVLGIPLLILEFSLGHLTQQAAPNAYGRLKRGFEFMGWWPILLSFVIVTYYAVVLAWCFNYLYYSVLPRVPWATDSAKFFFTDYLNYDSEASPALGPPRWPIVVGLGLVWLAMYLCIFRGVKWVSKVVAWTVPLPWLMLMILTVRGLTLEGAVKGLEYYLEPNWSLLLDPQVWRHAFGQVFFTLSLAFGVMVTYASFLHRSSDLNNNAVIVALSDFATSIVAGIAVFSTLGAMAVKSGVDVSETVSSSVGLAFVTFPRALEALPWTNLFSVIFFFALATLGIDSAFSITEATLASVHDKTGWRRQTILITMSVLGFLAGIVYTCSKGGLDWLGGVDAFINGPLGIIMVGAAEAIVIGWLFDIKVLRRHANERSDWLLGRWWDWCIRIVVPVVMTTLFAWNMLDDFSRIRHPEHPFLIRADGSWIGPQLAGLIIVAAGFGLAIALGLWRTRSAKRLEPIAAPDSRPAAGVRCYVGWIALLLGVLAFFGHWALLRHEQVVLERLNLSGAGPWRALTITSVAPAVLAALGIVLAAAAAARADRRQTQPAGPLRWGAITSIVATGLILGSLLYRMPKPKIQRRITYDGELSGVAYTILAVAALIIVGGLGWCFYKAISAINDRSADQRVQPGEGI